MKNKNLIPEILQDYILGKDSMPKSSDFSKKEKDQLNKKVIDVLGEKYITLYRGFSIGCESHEIAEIFLDQDSLVSFSENQAVAEEIAKERSLDEDFGVVIEIDLPTSQILFHYSMDDIGMHFNKEKEVIGQPYNFEWTAIKFYKNGKVYKAK